MRRFALYLSGDAALADDLTSEAFVRMDSQSARGPGNGPGLPFRDRPHVQSQAETYVIRPANPLGAVERGDDSSSRPPDLLLRRARPV